MNQNSSIDNFFYKKKESIVYNFDEITTSNISKLLYERSLIAIKLVNITNLSEQQYLTLNHMYNRCNEQIKLILNID